MHANRDLSGKARINGSGTAVCKHQDLNRYIVCGYRTVTAYSMRGATYRYPGGFLDRRSCKKVFFYNFFSTKGLTHTPPVGGWVGRDPMYLRPYHRKSKVLKPYGAERPTEYNCSVPCAGDGEPLTVKHHLWDRAVPLQCLL